MRRGILRILVVEDEPDTAETLSLFLRLHGHEVSVAANGPAALEQARVQQPDVVLLDIGLPRMSGWELAKRLRELADPLPKRPLLVAISGYGRSEDRRRSED